jgi:hypothetical protein
MGLMDKAKKLAEQAQQQAKDGTLKERAKALADQAQAKLDDVQDQFNERQQPSADAPGSTPAEPVPDEAVAKVREAAEASAPPSPTPGEVDRSHEAAPKLTGGDPLAG